MSELKRYGITLSTVPPVQRVLSETPFESKYGIYALYTEAAALLAEKDKRIKELEDTCQELSESRVRIHLKNLKLEEQAKKGK